VGPKDGLDLVVKRKIVMTSIESGTLANYNVCCNLILQQWRQHNLFVLLPVRRVLQVLCKPLCIEMTEPMYCGYKLNKAFAIEEKREQPPPPPIPSLVFMHFIMARVLSWISEDLFSLFSSVTRFLEI
jgi:hypothetical protein